MDYEFGPTASAVKKNKTSKLRPGSISSEEGKARDGNEQSRKARAGSGSYEIEGDGSSPNATRSRVEFESTGGSEEDDGSGAYGDDEDSWGGQSAETELSAGINSSQMHQ